MVCSYFVLLFYVPITQYQQSLLTSDWVLHNQSASRNQLFSYFSPVFNAKMMKKLAFLSLNSNSGQHKKTLVQQLRKLFFLHQTFSFVLTKAFSLSLFYWYPFYCDQTNTISLSTTEGLYWVLLYCDQTNTIPCLRLRQNCHYCGNSAKIEMTVLNQQKIFHLICTRMYRQTESG